MACFLLAASALASVIAPSQPFRAQYVAPGQGQTVTVCLDGTKVETTFAGKLGFRDQSHAWYSVCAAVRSPIAAGQNCTMRLWKSKYAGANYKLAGNIIAQHFGEAQNSDECAGLQLAVWEAIEDGGRQPDFSAGRFQARASARALAWAESYYQAANTPGNAVVLQASQQGGQDQITVPDPFEHPIGK